MCIGCDKRLTIEHILLICSDFSKIRVTLQLNHCVCCFRIFSPEKIFKFLKEIYIFGKKLI